MLALTNRISSSTCLFENKLASIVVGWSLFTRDPAFQSRSILKMAWLVCPLRNPSVLLGLKKYAVNAVGRWISEVSSAWVQFQQVPARRSQVVRPACISCVTLASATDCVCSLTALMNLLFWFSRARVDFIEPAERWLENRTLYNTGISTTKEIYYGMNRIAMKNNCIYVF